MRKFRSGLLLAVIFLTRHALCQDPVTAGKAFLSSLTPDLKSRTVFDIADNERFNWHFVPIARKGTTLNDYNPEQRAAAWAFLKASVGDQGFKKAIAITELENVLMAIEKQAPDSRYRDPGNYHFFLFGTPDSNKPWGWRFEGHHCSISIMVDKGKIISSTPSFFGSNPGIVVDSPKKGTEVLKRETDLGFRLVNALSAEQRRVAVIADAAPAEIITLDHLRAEELSPGGIRAGDMNPDQQKIFFELLDVFVSNYQTGFTADLDRRIRAFGTENLTFAWAGSLSAGRPNYYRIQGGTLLIEYDNTQNGANHVHTVVRDRANDFAEDILREHYKKEH